MTTVFRKGKNRNQSFKTKENWFQHHKICELDSKFKISTVHLDDEDNNIELFEH